MKRHTARGFTLIELMVTVAIIGILAAVAYPAYTRYLVKSNRSAAEAYLMDVAQSETAYMADARSYATTLAQLNLTTPKAVSDKYDISIAVTDTPPGFTITASPKTGTNQAGDGDLTLNNAGARTPNDKW